MKRFRWPVLILALVMGVGAVAVILSLSGNRLREFRFLEGKRPSSVLILSTSSIYTFHFVGDPVERSRRIDKELKAEGFIADNITYADRYSSVSGAEVVVQAGNWISPLNMGEEGYDKERSGKNAEYLTVHIRLRESDSIWDKLLRRLGVAPGGSGGP